jgi:hypothetical protein
MKRRRRTPLRRYAKGTIAERDEATSFAADAARVPPQRYANLRMPHERDERTHAPSPPSEVGTQAANDLAEGKRETDLYGKAGSDFDRTTGRS